MNKAIVMGIVITSNAGAQIKVGNKKDGGIVYWVDSIGVHGLIADIKDLGEFNWDDAIISSKNKGAGWRLPNRDELNKLYDKKEIVGGFCGYIYWSSTIYNSSDKSGHYAFGMIFFDDDPTPVLMGGYATSASWYVRAVRSF